MRLHIRLQRVFLVCLLASVLTACVGALLARAGTEVLLAILRPMVGLDPNANGLFQQPIIKERMQAFLGDQYDPVMQLIVTADQLQQEGPLFYVVSRYTPIPQIAEKAGFVWNSETNQMAVMLVTGGSPTVIAEKILVSKVDEVAAELVPQWPAELQLILDEDALKKQAADAAAQALQQPADTLRLQAQEQWRREAEAQLEAEIRAQEAVSP